MKSATRSLFGLGATIALISSLLCTAQTAPATRTAAQNPHLSRQVQTNYGKLPLAFEANQGQTDPQVKFLAHGSGYSVFLTSGQMVLDLRPSSVPSKAAKNSAAPATNQKTTDAVIQINLTGANQNPKIVGEDLQPGQVNYFIGKDPKKWQTNIATYKQVRYKDVYPGIDLVYYGNQSRVEHDFVIAPGADASQVQFDVKGADRLSIASNGDLSLHKGADEVRLQAPVVYQEFHGMRVPVTGQYKVNNSNHVSFTLGQYDKTMSLVIDPVLVYGTFLGGIANDQANGIAVDSNGSAYVTGSTQSINFPLASQIGPPPSGTNVFLAKLDVSGSSLVYADYIGGSSEDYPTAMAMDSSNHVFITGYTYSGDYPVMNPYQANSAGGQDAFVTEVASDGASLVYSSYLGGNSSDYGWGIVVDGTGNMYVAGSTYSQNFPTANAFQSTVSPNQNGYYGQYGFLTKLTPDGSALVYSTYYAGSTNIVQSCYGQPCWPSPQSTVSGVAVDGAGNAYIAGNTNTYDFPVTEGAYENSNATTYDEQVGFVAKLDSSGNVVYSTYFAATPDNPYISLTAVAVDTTGSAYIVGQTYPWTTALPITTPNLCDPQQSGCSWGFITKFDPTGSTLSYSTFLAANVDVWPQSFLVDANGDAYVLSQSGGGDQNFMVSPIETFSNQSDLIVQEIDPTGGTQLFSTFLGGNGDDEPGAIAVDSAGAIYVTGYTNSSDYPVTAAALQNTIGGNYDAFVTKIGTTAAPAVSISPSLIQFSIRPVGSVSQPNSSLLRNMGSAPLTISNITTTGDFSVDNDCGASIAAASTCTFTVTFTPTQPGPRFGSIMIEDDGAGSPHFINLVGSGATAVADLSPSSLTFPSLQINQTSPAQSATLTNNGNATLVISGIQITGDYAQTNNCPGSLGIGSSCQFQVTFTPTAGGAQNGTLSIADNAPGSPHTVTLAGSGYVTTATVTPSSLSFGNQTLGTTSAAQSVVITNTGANPITVSAVTPTTDFAETDNCTTTPVPVEGSCTINVTFSPTVGGTRNGTLTISDNAQGNPHIVTLSGTGLAGVANLSTASLNFTALTVGTTSTAQTITVTNSGNGALAVGSIQATGDFAQTNNCTTVAANGGTCAIHVTFTATSSGTRTGTIALTDSAANSPQSVSLTGSGIDFGMPTSGGSSTIKAGATATYSMSISPVGGTFSSAVSLVCAGVPAFSTCTVNPTSVTPEANPSAVTVTIKTTGTTAQLSVPGAVQRPVFALWTLTSGFGLFGMFLFGTGQGRKRGKALLLLIVLIAAVVFWAGCGTSHTAPPVQTGTSTPAGTYTVLVIGTSGSVQHFTSLTLTVQ
ncbi:MAG: choice-of-anchor D domain-containing protein [Acidobacteriia bacterium]|nr:choice-of-anchor D domain-containing protein [Terriglobia bacterium]